MDSRATAAVRSAIDKAKAQLLNICDIMHVYDNTFEPVRIIRKHKDDISIFANELWSEEQILGLMQ